MSTPALPITPSAPPPDASGDAAAVEMADVITAIFRMFDGHIDAMLGPAASAGIDGGAHPPVVLVGSPTPEASAPHG